MHDDGELFYSSTKQGVLRLLDLGPVHSVHTLRLRGTTELSQLRAAELYRLAYQLEIFLDDDNETAFCGAPHDVKVTAVAAGLQKYDANRAAPIGPSR